MSRVLGRLRLSVAAEESTSIKRQREVIEGWVSANGHEIVGWAEDVDVSGSLDPFDTPQLGDWLNNRTDEFDVICAWKLDRLSRNSIRLNKLFGWCLDHGKTVASTSEGIDLSTPNGRLIAYVIGFLAEGELEAIRERTISSRRKLRETSRWAGGRPPYGYRAADNPAGPGKVLVIDTEAHEVVRRIVDRVLEGVPLGRIRDELNEAGIRPPADHYRLSVGKEPLGGRWNAGSIRDMLNAPTLVGHSHLGGVSVRDDEGKPVLLAKEPLVTDDERELIRAELARTASGPRAQAKRSGPLVGVLMCYFCGSPLSSTETNNAQGRKYRYYRCHTNRCTNIPAETAEENVERALLDALGEEDVTERVWVPGDDHETALREAVAAFDELSETAGRMTSRTAKDRLQRQLDTLDARIAELETKPSREGRYENRPTGETYRQAWQRDTDPEARRMLLKRVGVTVRMGVQEGNLLSHVETLGDRLPVPEWAQVGEKSSFEEFQRYEEAAAAERRKYGVPDPA